MATTKVLDSYALVAFLEDEPGADQVRHLLLRAEEGSIRLAITVVNLGEVWYAIARADSPALADRLIHEIQGMAIEVVDVDWPLAKQAATFKARGRISYADCFAAALARLQKGEVITGDPEFKNLEGEIKVTWL
jgi:ribonuclease VapC